ncbi:MAG TPA: trehalose-phosphatase, partial [Flavobacteriaceae bacterium]|nr:trehalose-phosphatase [Flavobacteriaceae bacterium]
FINPLRDGMNLVAKEYIASRSNGTGVLVLSEMAGAAQELTEALIVNPYNFDQISDILKMALEMPKKEQIRRNQILQTHLKNHTVQQWAQGFLKELTKLDNKLHTCKEISPLLENEIANLFHSAKKSVVFLDYDGTLVEFKNDPQAVKPDPELLKILVQLTENQNTTIFLISGRDKETLEKWFSDIPINLIAEHGAWTRIENGKWKSSKKIDISWKDKILPVLKEFEQQFPGTFIEEKHFSIAWHYRNTKNTIPVKSLVHKIKESLQNKPLTILEGNKVLEITDNSISKGTAALENLKNKQYDFIFAMGDDTTDEFLFELLPENVISIKIGITETAAKYCLPDVAHARKLLKSFGEKKSDISFAKKKFKKSLS